jgi:hypothetical protein
MMVSYKGKIVIGIVATNTDTRFYIINVFFFRISPEESAKMQFCSSLKSAAV